MNFHSYKTNRTKGRKLNKAEQKQIVQAKLEKERSINKTTTEIQKYVLQKQNQKKEEIINKNKQDRLNHDKRTVELFKKKIEEHNKTIQQNIENQKNIQKQNKLDAENEIKNRILRLFNKKKQEKQEKQNIINNKLEELKRKSIKPIKKFSKTTKKEETNKITEKLSKIIREPKQKKQEELYKKIDKYFIKKKKILNDERETIEYNKRKVREKVKEKLNQLRLKKLNNNNTHQNRLTEHKLKTDNNKFKKQQYIKDQFNEKKKIVKNQFNEKKKIVKNQQTFKTIITNKNNMLEYNNKLLEEKIKYIYNSDNISQEELDNILNYLN